MEGIIENVEIRTSSNGKKYQKIMLNSNNELKTQNVFIGPELREGDRIIYTLKTNGQYTNIENIQIIGHTEERVKDNKTDEKENYWTNKTINDKEQQLRIGHSWSINAAIEICKLGPTQGKFASIDDARDAVLKEAQFLSEWIKDRVNLDLSSKNKE